MPVSLRQEMGTVNVCSPIIQTFSNKDNPPPPYHSPHRIVLYPGYTDFRVKISDSKTSRLFNRGDRARISTFSPRARNNLLKRLFSLSVLPELFITLTYPKYYPADSCEWKRHLDNYRHKLLEIFPSAWFFWKLEPQKRGAPHFHLIGSLNTEVNINVLRLFIAKLWYKVCGQIDSKHLVAGTSVEQFRGSSRRIYAYASKYIGKVDTTSYEGWETPGRFWGVIGRKNLPESIAMAVDLARKDFLTIRRYVRRLTKSLSVHSRRYAKRIGNLLSFFVFAPQNVIERMIFSILPPAPF